VAHSEVGNFPGVAYSGSLFFREVMGACFGAKPKRNEDRVSTVECVTTERSSKRLVGGKEVIEVVTTTTCQSSQKKAEARNSGAGRSIRRTGRVSSHGRTKTFQDMFPNLEEVLDGPKFTINQELFKIDSSEITLIKEIGAGGGGATIYKARWNEDLVAFKFFKTTFLGGEKDYDTFEKVCFWRFRFMGFVAGN